MIKAVTESQNESGDQYAQAGGLATEMLSAIRTVTALNAQPDAITRYREFILRGMKVGVYKSLRLGFGQGLFFCMAFFMNALGFWYGAKLLYDQNKPGCTGDGCLSGGKVISVFFCVLVGSSSLGQLAPPIGAFFTAKAAAASIIDIINRKPVIDSMSDDGEKPNERPKGQIELRDVEFAYPSRPNILVCKGYHLTIKPGETLALCGPSGSG